MLLKPAPAFPPTAADAVFGCLHRQGPPKSLRGMRNGIADTNVVVRYLVNDDVAQATRARQLLEPEDVFVSLTVTLETEWVLRAVYGFAPATVIGALRGFAGLARVKIEARPSPLRRWTGERLASTSPTRCIWRRLCRTLRSSASTRH